eukprot:CAMPEP_0201583478 /NCGR_PEP_ID=MMETSP0190_2-20130828/98898_1 /ASSEMBLY_ACC=CAM_ASM_000263 /TAXON_ID=37353 /ORGANISM="Rosalina sp." /LENGTH=171 /DNA_ID=CAMNT_0048025415 /DNA_START=8 /DNA_END=523 /DNA_ORIENTATION=+
MASMKALIGHHIARKFQVNIDFNKRRKYIKIWVTDELNEDEFEEIYKDEECPFGTYELKNVYETFNAAMSIGTPNVFNVYEEDGLCKIQIAKEKDMELPPFILRPTAGPCVQKYLQHRRKQRQMAKGQPVNDKEDDDDDSDDNKENEEDENPKVFQNKMPLAQPKPLKQKI